MDWAGLGVLLNLGADLLKGKIFPPKLKGQNHQGDRGTLQAVKLKKPRIHLFGHLHESGGWTCDEDTLYINIAALTSSTAATSSKPQETHGSYLISVPEPDGARDAGGASSSSSFLDEDAEAVM